MKKILLLLAILGFSMLRVESTETVFWMTDFIEAIQATNQDKFNTLLNSEDISQISREKAIILLQIANNQLQNIRNDASYYREARKESLCFFLASLMAIVMAQAYTQQQNVVDAKPHPVIIGATFGATVAFIDMLYYGTRYISTQWTNDKARKIVHKLEHLTVQAYREKQS